MAPAPGVQPSDGIVPEGITVYSTLGFHAVLEESTDDVLCSSPTSCSFLGDSTPVFQVQIGSKPVAEWKDASDYSTKTLTADESGLAGFQDSYRKGDSCDHHLRIYASYEDQGEKYESSTDDPSAVIDCPVGWTRVIVTLKARNLHRIFTPPTAQTVWRLHSAEFLPVSPNE